MHAPKQNNPSRPQHLGGLVEQWARPLSRRYGIGLAEIRSALERTVRPPDPSSWPRTSWPPTLPSPAHWRPAEPRATE